MVRFTALLAAAALAATAVHAQNAAAIKVRQDTMKAMADATKAPSAIAKGTAPFDLTQVKTSLSQIEGLAIKIKDLFPDDSKTGDTEALPVVFERKADVLARLDKLAADAKSAAASVTDAATFKTEWTKVVANCVGCHKEYRKPK